VKFNTLFAFLELFNLSKGKCVLQNTSFIDDKLSALLPSANFSSLATSSYFPELEWRNDAWGAHKHSMVAKKEKLRDLLHSISFCCTNYSSANIIFCIVPVHSNKTSLNFLLLFREKNLFRKVVILWWRMICVASYA
jgi:hypothetical protein